MMPCVTWSPRLPVVQEPASTAPRLATVFFRSTTPLGHYKTWRPAAETANMLIGRFSGADASTGAIFHNLVLRPNGVVLVWDR